MPDIVVLSHDEELNRLAAAVPRAVDRAVVVGDPRFDRLLASTHKRAEYRRALGVSDDEVFVVLSSTWSPSSLLGSWPDLPRRLLAELPVDGWRVGAVLHPHVWFEHDPRQVRLWLADCLRAGLILIPPEEGWSAALIAADVVIGDHGAVTCYAAGLGRPVLLAAFPTDEVARGSAVDLLGRHAPTLRPDLPLPEQINSARRAHPPHGHSAVMRMITSAPGQWAGSFRGTCYQRLSLSEPDLPPTTPVLPLPRPIGGRVLGLRVSGLVSAPDEVRLRRHPVDVPSRSDRDLDDTHLVIHADHPTPGFRDNADVVFIHATDSPLTPDEWLRHTTAIRHVAIAAVIVDERRCRIRLRDGRDLMVTGRSADPWLDPLAAVSAVHLLLARSDPTLPATVRVGASTFDLSRPPTW